MNDNKTTQLPSAERPAPRKPDLDDLIFQGEGWLASDRERDVSCGDVPFPSRARYSPPVRARSSSSGSFSGAQAKQGMSIAATRWAVWAS